MNQPDNSVRPPRWAEMLLHIVLPSGIAETESGDLLEAYRDSVYPQLGPWRADLWFIRQVAGYALRMRTTSLGNWILAGLMLCVFTTTFHAVRYPTSITLLAIGLMCVGIPIYACAAVFGTRPRNERHALVLRLGTRWGIAIGVWWIVVQCANLLIPVLGAGIAVLLAFVAFLLPFASASYGALKTGRIRDGIGICFWSGLISGVMTFLALLPIGYILHVSDVFDILIGHLFFIHGALNLFCGTIGSCAAILLERTGRDPRLPFQPEI